MENKKMIYTYRLILQDGTFRDFKGAGIINTDEESGEKSLVTSAMLMKIELEEDEQKDSE
jgi:hypothetical protein